jgi:hypothetical protein
MPANDQTGAAGCKRASGSDSLRVDLAEDVSSSARSRGLWKGPVLFFATGLVLHGG